MNEGYEELAKAAPIDPMCERLVRTTLMLDRAMREVGEARDHARAVQRDAARSVETARRERDERKDQQLFIARLWDIYRPVQYSAVDEPDAIAKRAEADIALAKAVREYLESEVPF